MKTLATLLLATSLPAAAGGWEATLGGGGDGTFFGTDLTLSTNPIKKRPEVWVGISQSLYWEPSVAGSTDLFVDWSQKIIADSLYVNVGWSGGTTYSRSFDWRTGPEVAVQWYTKGNAFIFAGTNLDVWPTTNWRYSFGIGVAF